MKKRNLLFAAIFTMVMFAGFSVKAQDSVFSYAYQGTTLYYIIDSNQHARVVPPLYPNMHYNADSTESSSWYGYAQPQGDVVVPESVVFNGTNYPVTAVEAYTFYRCYDVTSVTLPVTVTYLEHDAFWLATSLQSVSMPSVTWIGEACFYSDSSLTNVTVPAGVTELAAWTFGNCTSLQSVDLPDGITTMNDGVFYCCYSLQSVILPSTLTNIGSGAFYECYSLQSIDIPGSVNTIDDWSFNLCSSLTNVTMHEGTQTIGRCSFRECYNLTTINYPTSLKMIGDFAFQYDTSLAIPLILPEGLTYLGIVAYGDCSSIVTATIPGSLETIASQVFWGCSSLATVTIEDGITEIRDGAFFNCFSIDTLFVKCTVPPYLGTASNGAFADYHSVVVVPCSTAVVYHNYAVWELFSEIIEDCGVGIPEVDFPEVTIRVTNSCIEVEGAGGETVRVFDITGRLVRNEALSAGVYLVQIGNRPAQKVVVHPNM